MHHVILGAGPAGVIAAETLRKHAPQDAITLVGDEKEPPYSRMAIPYLLVGDIDERGTYLRKRAEHFGSQRIDLVSGQATRVNAGARTVTLDSGQTLAFDRLLIATGSHPVRAPIAGIELPGVQACWTLADARAIAQRAVKGARVLQLGAGFIGCIIMEALQKRGVQLSVVEMGNRMLSRMMGEVAGGMIRRWCESKGVQVFTQAKVERIEQGEDKALKVHVAEPAGNRIIEADLVISAIGVRPAIGFLENSGITCLLGVLTDEHMQTSVPGIYAAGDCAEAFDPFTGKTIVSAIQPNAAEQARVAALNMLGQAVALKAVTQINVLDTLGLISASFGNWQGAAGGQHAELTDTAAHRHLSLQFKDDVLVGCNAVGYTQHVGVMRGLVEGQIPLGEWKDRLLQNPARLMEAYLASAQAQGQWSGAAHTHRR